MNDETAARQDWAHRLALGLGLILVIIGMINNLPTVPGLLELVQMVPGLGDVQRISKFDAEFLFPIVFLLMMVIVVLNDSFARDWKDRSKARFSLGLTADTVMVLTTILLVLAYWIQNDQVCLIDQFTGERDRILASNAARAEEYRALFGTDPPEELPQCQAQLGGWVIPILLGIVSMFFVYNIKVWGFPLVAVAIIFTFYTIFSSLSWLFDWSENRYLITVIGGDLPTGRTFDKAITGASDAITLESHGLLGQFLNVLMNIVFPYVILGVLFGASAGGRSLIKLAVVVTRHLRGGPAHAATVSSALFGTISGGPVVNVLGTGTLTIPMMVERGFKRTFAGGVEAAASSGGQIMPPVMGVAAFVLASLTAIPYSEIIIAAFLPAIAYFASLFMTVMFESRRQNIQRVGELSEEMRLSRADWTNLAMVFVPILVILVLLLTSKDSLTSGTLAQWAGYEANSGEGMPWGLQLIRNAAGDPDSAGFWAVIVLLGMLFVDPDVRKKPRIILDVLSDGGVVISRLFLMFFAVAVIDICISFTDLPGLVTGDVLNWLSSIEHLSLFGLEFELGGSLYLFIALTIGMLAAIVLGMGMPTLPAYVNVILLLGPLLIALGVSTLTAHMFVFYFAVASSITPPVAIAAFAAASITKADPMATGLAAVRAGIVMFIVPFVFAFYPELLLIEQAQLVPSSGEGGKKFLPGYDGSIDFLELAWLLVRILVSLYLVASALSRFDAARLSNISVGLRLVLAVLILFKLPLIATSAFAVALIYLAGHHLTSRPKNPSHP
ncbi:TRAP transporter fused permease subunit [Gammaproteobacteria bacterium]|nr:TRAP transporter fused permease subunit [Gammaproteobacteria bacterium]